MDVYNFWYKNIGMLARNEFILKGSTEITKPYV